MPPPLRVRYSKIAALVDDLLDRHRITTAPVPLERIATAEGLLISKKPLDDDVSGFLLRSGSSMVIGVNGNQAPNRRRFTIAHELGHALLHEGDELHVDRGFRINFRDVNSSLASEIEEIESNTFAAWLLMPTRFLVKHVGMAHLDIDDGQEVAILAKKYGVSAQAMTYRLLNLANRGA